MRSRKAWLRAIAWPFGLTPYRCNCGKRFYVLGRLAMRSGLVVGVFLTGLAIIAAWVFVPQLTDSLLELWKRVAGE